MSEYLRKFYSGVDKFREEINAIPSQVRESNKDLIDFTDDINKHQSIMIDLEGLIGTLHGHFFLFSEEMEDNIIKAQQQEIDELKAHVEYVMTAFKDLSKYAKVDITKEFMARTPKQSLQEIKAQAIEKAVEDVYFGVYTDQDEAIDACQKEDLLEIAKQLRNNSEVK